MMRLTTCLLILLPMLAGGQPILSTKKSDAYVLKFYGEKTAKHHSKYPTTVIGDSTKKDFDPSFTVDCWSGEAFLKVNLSTTAHDLTSAVKAVTTFNSKDQVELATADVTHKMYAIGEKGFEWEIVLPSKPASNIFTYSIETANLTFTQSSYDEFDPEDGDPRPDSIQGHWKAYHTTKKNNVRYINGADTTYEAYKTGKAFVIYRPKVYRKDGKFTWADLNIDPHAETLTLTVPQKFLDDAEVDNQYPVVIDPQVGYTSIGTDGDHTFQDYARFNGFNQPEAGDVDSLVCRIVQCGGVCTGEFRLGLFTNTGACGADSTACNPNALIDTTVIFSPTDNSWMQQAATLGASLSASTMYWMGAIAEDVDPEVPYDNNVYGDDPYENDNNGWSWDDFNDPVIPDNSTSHRTYTLYWVYTATGAEVSRKKKTVMGYH